MDKPFFSFQDNPDFDSFKNDSFYKKRRQFRRHKSRGEDVSTVLENVLNHPLFRDQSDFFILSEHLSEIVGTLLVKHVFIADIRQKKLFLKVPHAVWKSEINLQKKAIIDRCNTLLKKPAVTDICFI